MKVSEYPTDGMKPIQVEDLKYDFTYILIVDDSEDEIEILKKQCLEYSVTSDIAKEVHDL